MAPPKLSRVNPLAFTPWPVTLVTATVYLALVIPLLVIHHVVPSAPSSDPSGLNLTEAWADLQVLSSSFHPYNSRRNDVVHDWLLTRIDEIVNAASPGLPNDEKPDVFVFDDDRSNLTFTGSTITAAELGVYFEGTNIIVYIRRPGDNPDQWWEDPNGTPRAPGGVLVNSHYDSVSTGFGATDDGVGVVTCLQLIKYFTSPGNAPRRGLVVLFNNGEEDFLNGARVYSQHPISRLPHTFLNLEGAGAGGRAALFRSTDTEVTRPYLQSPHPFGSVLAANGFDMHLISSQTDYVVFNGDLGLRGLDVAFIEPRARYHTNQDDARHTSKDSLWHMLSAAVATTTELVSDASDQFDGPPSKPQDKISSGTGSKAVWFDLFGSTFVVFRLHTLFALSVTLLIVAPLTLLFTSIALTRADKMYLFRSSAKSEDGLETVSLQGLRGFFRFPSLFVIPTGVTVGLAYLVTKVNPFIVHGSEYSVWSMMISAWVFLAWFVSRVADFARPSALHRVYTLTWLFVVAWVLQVIATVYEHQRGLAGGYFIFFLYSGVFLATWISYLELFSLPRKTEYANQVRPVSRRPSSYGSRLGTTHSQRDDGLEENEGGEEDETDPDAEEEPTESTSLLGGGQRTTFANYVRVAGENGYYTDRDGEDENPQVYGREQAWSLHLPKWTWVLQFLLIAPIVLILVGPLALLLTSALHQTGQDGSPRLFVYIAVAVLTTLLLLPLLPFIHRYTYHLPMFLLLVLLGTLVYNLVAFPFSESNRVKLYFMQEVDLDNGSNRASLTGMPPFVEDVAKDLPSAAGQNVSCAWLGNRSKCAWAGLTPLVTAQHPDERQPPMADWVSFNISRSTNDSRARFEVSGLNTRACKIVFDRPISGFHVDNGAVDPRFPHTSSTGIKEVRLWSRTWDRSWHVDIEWTDERDAVDQDLSGRVVCLWSDHNQVGLIPALDEIMQFAPVWVAVSKLTDGLVEGSRAFSI
ncbi:M28 family metallopeptidase [Aspergillus affinis]|uniref:M28 family metallopeptidase n=1 Tax=Aspergillus affinis TaxID=1070780 RepID=UPI0022FDDD90|nr:uncharacterized protein KD926_007057 [Aspergillus affinis]KAI9045754.1 hypothetical protein KD926_007057 [Aspergillus affinis]